MADIYIYSGGSNTAPYDTWAKAATSFATGVNAAAAGDSVWVAHDHNETGAAAITITGNGTITSPVKVICALRTGSVPPVAADIRATAVVQTANGAAMAFGTVNFGDMYYEGIIFQSGSGSTGSSNINFVVTQNNRQYFKNCTLDLNNSNAGSLIDVGGTSTVSLDLIWDNVKVEFGNASQIIRASSGRLRWINTPTAYSGTVVTNLFSSTTASRPCVIEVEGVDLSGKSSGNIVAASAGGQLHATFLDCELHASATLSAEQTISGHEVVAARSAATGINYSLQRFSLNGNQQAQTAVVRTGGSEGPDGQAVAWRITTGSAAKVFAPFDLIPIAVWNETIGSSVTATMHGIIDAAALPTNAEIWVDFYYPVGSGDPRAAIASTAPATILTTPANLTATTEAWDTGATARANSTAYSLGDVIKVASNPGRVFFCTTAGTTSGSEPAGYATATDGSSPVTDGTAAFRAGMRFKMEATFTPELVGPIRAKPFVSKASAARWYIDPDIVLS